MKEVVILGGPNGAGKTSWAFARLQPALCIREFINADEIARGLSPFNPDGVAIPAGRLLIERIMPWQRPVVILHLKQHARDEDIFAY